MPDDRGRTTWPQNNRATAFTHVRGSGQVLLIEDQEKTAASSTSWSSGCGSRTSKSRYAPSDQLFSSLAELQPYDW